MSGLLKLNGDIALLSEISYYPFGYIFLLKDSCFDNELLDITFFAQYEYNDWKEFSFIIPSRPIYTWMPGDFRTQEQVELNFIKNNTVNPC